MTRRRRPDFTDDEITHGLVMVVAWAGDVAAASRALAVEGREVPAETLSLWIGQRADEYNELRDRHAGALEAEMVRQLRESAAYIGQVQRKAARAAEDRLDAGKDFDPAKTATGLAKAQQSLMQQLLTLTGRPSQITETRTPEEITRSLIQSRVLVLVDEPQAEPAALPSGTVT